MFALTQQESSLLLTLLLSSEDKSLRTLEAEFEKAFPEPFRACCAAVLLLEDPTILRLPQRIAAWFLLSLCDVGVNGASPFLAIIAKAASSTAAAPPERNFVLQLLQGPLPNEVADSTPRGYASYCDCRLLRSPDTAALLQEKALAGLGRQGNSAAATAPAAPSAPASSTGCAAGPEPQPQRPPQDSSAPRLAVGAGAAGAAAAAGAPGASPSAPAPASASAPGQSGAPQLAHQHHRPPQPAPATAPAATPAHDDGAAAAAGGSGRGGGGGSGAGLLGATWERPRPAVLTPLPSELKWLNPDLHTELLWDSDLGEAAAAAAAGPSPPGSARDLLSAALRGPLLPAQQQALLAEWDADPRVILRLGLAPRHLPALVEANPGVATEALLRLARWPGRYAAFLDVLARSEMSLHSLEVVNRLTAGGAVPTEFVHLYITNCINSCEGTQDKYVQNRLVRLVCVFLQSLIRNKVIDIHDLLHEVQAFCINFSRIREAAKLFRLLKQIEAGMRGADNGAGPAGGHGGAEEALALPDCASGSVNGVAGGEAREED